MASEAVLHGGKKGFAMRLLVQAFATVAPGAVFLFVDEGGEVEETLRSQEKTVHRPDRGAAEPQAASERRRVLSHRHVGILGATLDVEAELLRDGFQQSRFARTVLADEKRDFGMQF